MICLLDRYFGTAEGSKFVEYASANSVKRTWVNYGLCRDWLDTEQGQVHNGAHNVTIV